jgi:hypothetical protein
MIRMLCIGAVVLLVAGGAGAQLPPEGFIGLFTDDSHSNWCTEGIPMYPVEMWIWCLPSENGQMCAEFAVSYPSNVIQSTVNSNDAIISVMLGDLPNGVSVCYLTCQYEWNWPFHQTLYVTSDDETDVTIIPHLGVGLYQFANCQPGYPTELCNIYSDLNINHCELVSSRETTWGAVKALSAP